VSKIGKILRKMGQKKRIAGKKNRWKKKQNRRIPTIDICGARYNGKKLSM